jgi:hypothetical protein
MNNIQELIYLLKEYMEAHVQINPKSIVNTLKQLNAECRNPYGLKYDDSENGRRMDMIVFYYADIRYDITLINEYIVSIEMGQELIGMNLELLF